MPPRPRRSVPPVRRVGVAALLLVPATVVMVALAPVPLAPATVAAPVPDPGPSPSATSSPSPTAVAPLPELTASPGPTASPTATPTETPTPMVSAVPTAAPARAPADRVDRQWPKNPPWDACPRPVWPGVTSTGTPGQGRRVLVIGDSLTRESRVATAKALRASGWTPTFRCWGSKRLDWGISQIRRAKQLGQLPEYVVMALGTNDASWVSRGTTQARLSTVLKALGPKRQVIWVNLDVDYSSFSRGQALWFNDVLRRVAADRPNLTVVNWRSIARGERAGRFDGIHYFGSGYRLRARTVTAAVNRLGRAQPAPSATSTPTPVPTPTPTPTSTPTPAGTPTPSSELPSASVG